VISGLSSRTAVERTTTAAGQRFPPQCPSKISTPSAAVDRALERFSIRTGNAKAEIDQHLSNAGHTIPPMPTKISVEFCETLLLFF